MLYLLPPSEGKNSWGIDAISQRTFVSDLPLDIAISATPKDLKCKWARYEEGMGFNTMIETGPVLPAIRRYSGVMYNAIWYETMSEDGQRFFDEHILILSGMYGVLRPQDTIANYKLPIDTKWLRQRWWDRMTDILLQQHEVSTDDLIIVDLLSGGYSKMLNQKLLREAGVRYVQVEFVRPDGSKHTHWVKKVKGQQVREWMEQWVTSVKWLGSEMDGDVVRVEC